MPIMPAQKVSKPNAMDRIAQAINMLGAGANAVTTGISLFKGSGGSPQMGSSPSPFPLGVDTNVLPQDMVSNPMARRYQQIMRF